MGGPIEMTYNYINVSVLPFMREELRCSPVAIYAGKCKMEGVSFSL